ncbi:heme A synthase [Brumimicrobium salinarum]|uniref:Heme A synthase n=1 Tax=Brumimicrobium salinarum TaxID=2058658 RepID=A0A2I0R4H3_9FLAO|nr:COX15/CtaA family protein [Brumimicrobium salinarum]PKR81483.1 heme A synthase [Brumimicrobium salinarum]
MKYGKWFVRVNWITLVFIFLVVIAGSFVRITGSGMGCPDWPKCFGQWVPPTEKSALPEDYKDIYSDKRAKKVEKFSNFLAAIGMETTADKIRNDKSILIEQDFNARKTWTEYVNRLFGFLAGNGVLLVFLWIMIKYREKRLIFVGGINLVLLAFQAWFGSIVVATNLVPWTITVHLFLALVIIGLQIYLLRMVSPSQQRNIKVSKQFYGLLFLIFFITFAQMFLGTQVREEIDHLTKAGIGREGWSENLGLIFFIHRSFSWLVLALIVGMFWIARKRKDLRILHWAFAMLVIELLSGVILNHFNVPGLVQTAHLLFACILFGILMMAIFRLKTGTKNLNTV